MYTSFCFPILSYRLNVHKCEQRKNNIILFEYVYFWFESIFNGGGGGKDIGSEWVIHCHNLSNYGDFDTDIGKEGYWGHGG